MIKRPTVWFTILVIGIAAYTVYDYRKAQLSPGLAEHEEMAFSLKPDDIRRIHIRRGSNQIELERGQDKEWKIVKPVDEIAEGPIVDGYLYSLVTQRLSKVDLAKTHWSEYGLEDQALTITVDGAKKSESITISEKSSFDGGIYVRLGDQLMMADSSMAQLRDRELSSFRSKRLWPSSSPQPVVEVKVAGTPRANQFSLIREKDNWRVEPKPPFEISEERVERWIERIRATSANSIVADGLDVKGLAEYGLDRPKLTISFSFGAGTPSESLSSGLNKAGEAFATVAGRNVVYGLGREAWDLFSASNAYFREGKKPFQFSLEQAARVETHFGNVTYQFKKVDSEWKLKDGKANQDGLIQLFQNISKLEAEEFPSGGNAQGFKDPQLTIYDNQGKVLLALSWGSEYPAKETYNTGKTFRYVKTNVGHAVMGMPKAVIDQLLKEKLVEPEMKEAKGENL